MNCMMLLVVAVVVVAAMTSAMGDFPTPKVIKDNIHGHIPIPKLCLQFMNVPEFQRLRRVKQLGVVHYSYPCAVHTRFSHSIGVMHLAGKVVDQLRNFVHIGERTKTLIQLAGLYHDIGHFAFSHLFDTFLETTDTTDTAGTSDVSVVFSLKHHEDRSVYFLKGVNDRLGLLTPGEVTFVELCIRGDTMKGYPSYLFEIVSNSISGLDVDRQDYINRDAKECGFPSFQSDYIIHNMAITSTGHIGVRHKAKGDVKDFFDTRTRMYMSVYFHHTSLKVEKMVWCMMKRLGTELFKYGEATDDYNIETLLRMSDVTKDTMLELDSRHLEHECDVCRQYRHHSKTLDIDWLERVLWV